MLGQQRPLVGMVGECVDRAGQLITRRVGAGHQQSGGQHPQLREAEAVAVVFGADQIGDQIVGETVAPVGNHLVDVGVEFVPVGQDRGNLVGGVPAERLEELVGPRRELFPIAGRCAQQRANDRDRIVTRNVGDDVAVSATGALFEQRIDHLFDRRAKPLGGSGCERLADQSPQPMVLGALETDDVVDHPIPQRTRRNALRGKEHAGRHDESWIPQSAVNEFIGQ